MNDKIHIKIKPIEPMGITGMDVVFMMEKINQIIFVLNELNITINKDDEKALEIWKDFMEKNK